MGGDWRRDLPGNDYQRHLIVCGNLWKENPVAKKAVKNMVAFVCSEGFRIKATCPDDAKRAKIQAAIDEHYRICNWEAELPTRVATLAVEGEWDYWVTPPNPITGHIRITKILPECIEGIERLKTDAETLRAAVFCDDDGESGLEFEENGQSVRKKRADIVRRDPITGRITGEVLHLGVNKLSGQTRGWSDLLVVADYLDAMETYSMGEIDRARIQRSIVWRYLLKGNVAPEKLAKRKAEILEAGPPEPASVLVQVENEEDLDCIAPTLNLQESIAFLEFLLMIIMGGLDMPQHFFSSGGDVNKATASEMGNPVWALVRERKRLIMAFMRLACELCLQTLLDRGRLGGCKREDLTIEVLSRDPERNSYALIGEMLKNVCDALVAGVDAGFASDVDAGRAYRTAASQLGLGDFAEPTNLDDARKKVAARLEQQRPKLEQEFPLKVKDGLI